MSYPYTLLYQIQLAFLLLSHINKKRRNCESKTTNVKPKFLPLASIQRVYWLESARIILLPTADNKSDNLIKSSLYVSLFNGIPAFTIIFNNGL